jgi:hypothetical protein
MAALKNPNPELGPERLHEGHVETAPTGLPKVPPASTSERNSEQR